MKSFSMGLSYLRAEALKTGFIIESDKDDVLVERISQVLRTLSAEAAEQADAMTSEGQARKPGGEEVAEAVAPVVTGFETSIEEEEEEEIVSEAESEEDESSTDQGTEREA